METEFHCVPFATSILLLSAVVVPSEAPLILPTVTTPVLLMVASPLTDVAVGTFKELPKMIFAGGRLSSFDNSIPAALFISELTISSSPIFPLVTAPELIVVAPVLLIVTSPLIATSDARPELLPTHI